MILNDKRISWIYLTEEGVISNYSFQNIKTRCIIKKGDEILAVGDTLCGQNDSFCRDTGRKKSLGRALKELYPTNPDQGINIIQKAKRFEVWEVYRNLSKHPKWECDGKRTVKDVLGTIEKIIN